MSDQTPPTEPGPEQAPEQVQPQAHEQAPQYAPPPYQPPQYAQPQYAQPQHAPPQYPSPQWAQPQSQYPPGYPPGYPAYPVFAPPDHPKATTAFILAMIAGPGALASCGLTLLAAPFAWIFGAQARKAIRQSPGQYGGEGKATAAFVIGIIATALLVLVIAGIVAFIVWGVSDPTGFEAFWDEDPYS